MIEWKLDVNTLLNLGTVIIGAIALYIAITNRMTRLETMLEPIWKWWNESSPTTSESSQLIDKKIEHSIEKAIIKHIPQIFKAARGEK